MTGIYLKRRPKVRIKPLAESELALYRPPRQRVGLLGGSFNPAHAGHRQISLDALRCLALDAVWWLVSPQNPLKSTNETAPLGQRMVDAQRVANHPKIYVTGLEAEIGTQYSADTVAYLQRRYAKDFVWLIGADNLVQLHRWHRWHRLFACVPIAVFDREPYSHGCQYAPAARTYAKARRCEMEAFDLASLTPPAWVFLHTKRNALSSTAIRRGHDQSADRPPWDRRK